MQVFSKEWFDKYQKPLCWLANNKLTKRWFRYVLRIRSFDCPLDVNINRIEPNAFWFGGVKKGELIEIKADFRTHDEFSKRLYFSFKLMWWAFHAWDWLVADRFVPELSFGFSTLTAYPVPGTTVDGRVRVDSAADWANAHDVSSGSSFDYTSTTLAVDSSFTGSRYSLARYFLLYDTSGLTSGATISSAYVSLFSTGLKDNDNTTQLHIVSSSPASNTSLANSDFPNLGSTSYGNIAFASYSAVDGTENQITVNATGLSDISKTSITKWGLRTKLDLDNSAPSGYNGLGLYTASYTGTTRDPKLVVTYTLPQSGGAFLCLMV